MGTANLIFNFSGGAAQSLDIQVSDTSTTVNPDTNNETTPTAVTIKGTERVGKTLEAVLLTEGGAKFITSAGVTYDWYRLALRV